jgi:protein gp37
MADNTAIEWTHRPGTKGETWNPIVAWRWIADPAAEGGRRRLRGWHCEHVSQGCTGCYSERQNVIGARGGTLLPYKPGHRKDVEIELHEPTLVKPLHWKAPRTIFVCSMTDLFADFVTDEMIARLFAVMALSPQHTYQVLTKRPERMRAHMTRPYPAENVALEWKVRACSAVDDLIPIRTEKSIAAKMRLSKLAPLPNVWLGTSCEDQATADERVPELLATPAAIRFVSAEPLLGGIDFTRVSFHQTDEGDRGVAERWTHALRGTTELWYPHRKGGWGGIVPARLDWIICGGESGPKARPMHPAWARSIRDQCKAAGTAFFFKQWGEWGIDTRGGVMADTGERATWVGKSGRTYNPSAPNGEDCWAMMKVGRKAAGRLLDGREWSEFPEARS